MRWGIAWSFKTYEEVKQINVVSKKMVVQVLNKTFKDIINILNESLKPLTNIFKFNQNISKFSGILKNEDKFEIDIKMVNTKQFFIEFKYINNHDITEEYVVFYNLLYNKLI
jgi:hypothetical protein